ncbi:MAG: ABC transporter ATP-binding protein [Candidatus Omnitrophota bacterium]
MSSLKRRKFLAPLLYFIKPYPRLILGVVLLILTVSILEGFNILVIFGLLKTVLSSEVPQGRFALFTMKIVKVIGFDNKLLSAVTVIFLIILLKCILDFFRRYFTAFASCKIWHDVQYKVFNKCVYADYQFFLDTKEGEIIYRGFTAPSVMGVTLQYSCEFLAEIVKLIIIMGVLFAISLKFSFVIVVFSALFYMLTNIIAKKVTYYIGKGRQESSVSQTVILAELINGIKPIKIFLSQNRWIKEYDQAMCRYFNLYVKDESWRALPPNVLELLAVGLLGMLLVSFKITNAGISASQLSMLGVYVYSFYRFMPSFKNISAKRLSYVGNLAIVENLYEFLKQDIKEINDGKVSLKRFDNSINLENVDFSYPQGKDVLKHISFEIKKGETIAIVGKSGSGKTTIANLILRLFTVKNGRILIDNINMNDLKIDTWLSKIGYVAQDTFIFNATVADNIVFGRPFDSSKLLKAIELANVDEFIQNLENGYDTLVGDRGMKLSGGQRQRIAIARAMYNDPEILLFDEATSSLDNHSETMIQNALNKISSNHTVILIAHRLSTVMGADKIIVLDSGSVVEQGVHQALLNKGGLYFSLYNREAQAEPV